MTKTTSALQFLAGYARRRPATAIAFLIVIAAVSFGIWRAIQ